jgi:hypothetical protein
MSTPADRLRHLAGIVRRLEGDYRQTATLAREHLDSAARLVAELPMELDSPAVAILARSPAELEATRPEELDAAGIPADLVGQILADHRAARRHEAERVTLSGRLRDARLLLEACQAHAARKGMTQ